MEPAELFRSLRAELESTGALGRGRLDLSELDSGRVQWIRDGEKVFTVPYSRHSLLAVKWPTLWQLLDHLPETRFLVCIRDPLEVVASFGAQPGRLSLGLDYDVAINKRMNDFLRQETSDPLRRRALHWEYINSRVFSHLTRPNVLAVRYERWFEDPGDLLSEISMFLETDMSPGRITLRSPASREYSPETLRVVTELCPTAIELGYGS